MNKILLLTILSISAFSQTKEIKAVVNNDSNSNYKADTSIVTINDSTFQKIVSVKYKFISEEILLNEFAQKAEFVKQQIERSREDRQRINAEIERLKAELDAERSFYQKAKKELKYSAKDADEGEKNRERQQIINDERRAKIETRDNPRRKGN